MLMRPKHSFDRLLTLKASGVHDLMGSIAAELRKKYVVNIGMPGAAQSRAFYRFVTAHRASDILNRNEMIIVIVWQACSLTADSFSNQCLERIWAKLFDLFQSLSASEPA